MHSYALWPTVIVLVIAIFTDLRSRRIPNWLVLPFMIAGLVVPACFDGWNGLLHSAEGFGLGALVFGFISVVGSMGMGDVKLVAAIGAWVGPRQLVLAMVLTAMTGGLIALAMAIPGAFKGEVWKSRKIPYAPAIAVGTFISFFSR
jgi:prepilin peptidase CpaA